MSFSEDTCDEIKNTLKKRKIVCDKQFHVTYIKLSDF